MASTNITSGRVSPIISEMLLTAAAGNAGKYVHNKLPIWFDLRNGSLFKGSLRVLPVAQVYGDGRVVGTDALKRQSGSKYYDLTRERSFDTVAYECVEKAAKVLIDEQDVSRTSDSAIAGLTMRQSRAMQLASAIRDDLEKDTVAAVFNTSNFANAAAAALTGGTGNAWTAAGSSPSQDGVAVQNLIRTACGAKPDFAVMTWNVAQALRYHPETLNVKVVTSGAAPVASPVQKMADVMQMWADRWELEKGLFVVGGLYNSANPAATATLAEFETGKIAFHTCAGLSNATQVVEDVDVLGGQVSLVGIRESGYRGYEDPTMDPHGIQLAAKHSYAFAVPYSATSTRPAYIITSVA